MVYYPSKEAEDLRHRVHEGTESFQKRGVINQDKEDKECQNEKIFDSNYENAQESRCTQHSMLGRNKWIN